MIESEVLNLVTTDYYIIATIGGVHALNIDILAPNFQSKLFLSTQHTLLGQITIRTMDILMHGCTYKHSWDSTFKFCYGLS